MRLVVFDFFSVPNKIVNAAAKLINITRNGVEILLWPSAKNSLTIFLL